jgi:hypothetical protein
MQKYINDIIGTSGSTLSPITGATCSVYLTGTSTLATLYSDNGVTPKANPISSSSTGRIEFYAADGRYDISVVKSGYTTVTLSDILLEDLADATPGVFTTVTASSLTAGRVAYAGTGGLLQTAAALTFDGTTLASTKFSGALNGTVGATTPSTGAFTTLSATGDITLSGSVGRVVSNADSKRVLMAGGSSASTTSGAYAIFEGYDFGGAGAGGAISLVSAAGTTNPITMSVGGTTRGVFSSTGLAVTGTLTSTGNGLISNGAGAITNPVGWTNLFQIRSDNSPAFSLVDTRTGAVQQWDLGSNGVNFNLYNATLGSAALTVTAATNLVSMTAGLAVTGTLSSTGTGQVGTTLGVGAATPSASGAGITFPATQSASTDANTLDDYEEGTWTGTVTASIGSITSYTASYTYTKIGNLVNIRGSISVTNNGTGSGHLRVAGIPFSSSNVTGCGFEGALGGKQTSVSSFNTTTIEISNYDYTYPASTGASISFTALYAL